MAIEAIAEQLSELDKATKAEIDAFNQMAEAIGMEPTATETPTPPTPPEEVPAPITETPAEVSTETPPEPEAPAKEPPSDLPDWSKPLQKTQQEIANQGKVLQTVLATLVALQKQSTAAPATAPQKDKIAEIEAKLSNPEFDPYKESPEVMRQTLAELRAIRQEMKQSADATAQATARETAYWQQYAKSFPNVDRNTALQLWQSVKAEIEADPMIDPADRTGAANLRFRQVSQAAQAKALQPTSTSPKSPAAVTSSGGRIIPKGAVEAKPKTAPRNLEQRVAAGDFGLVDELL